MNDVTSNAVPLVKHERLKFIDIGRSIAIILMLQGHFITLTFKDYKILQTTLIKTGTSGYILFDWWVKLRGFTAPLFFTITGLVFVYLLTKHDKPDDGHRFFKLPRVRKGIRRAISILLWAYALQINLKYIRYYLKGNLNEQIFAFHILQSIAIGILTLILIYGFYKFIKRGYLPFFYFLMGTFLFLCYPFIHSLADGNYFPKNAPLLIQNMFYGPKSEFPIVPWMGFVMFGGMLGSLVHMYEDYVRQRWFPIVTFIFGILIICFGRLLGHVLDISINHYNPGNFLNFEKNAWLYDRLGEVILLLGVLIWIDQTFKIRNSLFLKMGQNTLPIYIIHVIILYGAIIGYSLRNLFQKSLTGGESVFGAILFILIFTLFIKYIEWIEHKIHHNKKRMKKGAKSIFNK